MKTRNTYLFFCICFVSLFCPAALRAQSQSYIQLNKTADYDYSSHTGIITLDSFVTGEVRQITKSVPADICLVLDFSTSMKDNNKNTMLSNSAQKFVDDIVASATANSVTHRIAIVTFGTQAHMRSDFVDVTVASNVTALKNIIKDVETKSNLESSTRYDLAMDVAKNVILGGTNVVYDITGTTDRTNYTGSYNSTTDYFRTMTYSTDSSVKKKNLSGKRSDASAFLVFFTDGTPTGKGYYINDFEYGGSLSTTTSYDTPQTKKNTTTKIYSGTLEEGYDSGRYDYTGSQKEYYRFEIANMAIRTAHQIKKNSVSIYSIFLGDVEAGNSKLRNFGTDILEAISSKYPDATRYRVCYHGTQNTSTSSWFQWVTDVSSSSKSLDVAFSNITSSIQEIVSVQYGAETIMNDFINNSYFKLTNAVDPDHPWESIHVYTVNCNGIAADGVTRTFSSNHSDTTELHSTDGINILITKSNTQGVNDKISVSGFDYSSNWCGKLSNGTAHGKKIVVKVPFEFTGGLETQVPSTVKTNGSGSGIYPAVRDSSGNIVTDQSGKPTYESTPEEQYVSPTISFCTIKIVREGLDPGESAIYEIKRGSSLVGTISLNGTSASSVEKYLYGLPSADFTVTETSWNWAYDKKVHNGTSFVAGNTMTKSVTDPNTVVEYRFGGSHKTGTGPEDMHNHDEEFKVNKISLDTLK